MFERFTEAARRVVVYAQEESVLLHHNYIGTEHLLLGVLAVDECVGATALTGEGVSRDRARREVVRIIGEGAASPSGHIPFTPRAKKVLELSLREALQLHHNYIGTAHIALAIIREGEGVAAQIVTLLAGDAPRVRRRIERMVAEGVEDPATSAPDLSTGTPDPSARPSFGFSWRVVPHQEQALKRENERLRRLLLEHGIDPETDPGSPPEEDGPPSPS